MPVRKPHHKGKNTSAETAPLANVGKRTTIYISEGEGPRAEPATTPPPPGSLPPPPPPPSAAVLWAEFSPSNPRQPATTVVAVSPRKPCAVVIERIDGAYLIGNRRIEIRDQTARPMVDVFTPPAPAAALVH